jgi:hypothetical protein
MGSSQVQESSNNCVMGAEASQTAMLLSVLLLPLRRYLKLFDVCMIEKQSRPLQV